MMQLSRFYCTLFVLLLIILSACGPASPPATGTPALIIGPLPQIAAGQLDGRPVTVQAVYYERGNSRLLIPALTLTDPGGPVPLIVSPSEAIMVDKRPPGNFRRVQEVTFGPVRITGQVAKIEGGRMIEVREAKVIEPVPASLDLLLAGGFNGTVVEVEATLLARPGSLLLVSAVGAGGVPESGADQAKVVIPMEDETLLNRLERLPDSNVRYGPVRAVGYWMGNALQLMWAEPR